MKQKLHDTKNKDDNDDNTGNIIINNHLVLYTLGHYNTNNRLSV